MRRGQTGMVARTVTVGAVGEVALARGSGHSVGLGRSQLARIASAETISAIRKVAMMLQFSDDASFAWRQLGVVAN